MNLAIFGATGKAGRHLLQQALEQGHAVSVLVRSPEKLAVPGGAGLRVVRGDVGDAARVAAAVAGAEAVLSVLGPTRGNAPLAVSRGVQTILQAMQSQGLRRLVVSAGAGVRLAEDRPTPMHAFFGALVRVLAPAVYEDMRQVVAAVRASDTDWTIVRVPMLTDAPGGGRLYAGSVGPQLGRTLSRADLAAFMLRAAEDGAYVRQAPALSN